MLVLSRKPQETIVLDGGITITIVDVRGNQVRLGIEAPRSIVIRRGELGRDEFRRDELPHNGAFELRLPAVGCGASDG